MFYTTRTKNLHQQTNPIVPVEESEIKDLLMDEYGYEADSMLEKVKADSGMWFALDNETSLMYVEDEPETSTENFFTIETTRISDPTSPIQTISEAELKRRLLLTFGAVNAPYNLTEAIEHKNEWYMLDKKTSFMYAPTKKPDPRERTVEAVILIMKQVNQQVVSAKSLAQDDSEMLEFIKNTLQANLDRF